MKVRLVLELGKAGGAQLVIADKRPAPALPKPSRRQRAHNTLVVETIEAFHDDKGTGPIARHPATGNPSRPPCEECGIRPAKPMNRSDAAFVRERFADAGMQSAAAYAFVMTRVLLTARNQERLCRCDREAWLRAWQSFRGAASWSRIGVWL